MAWSMDFVVWERGRRVHLMHHQIGCLHLTLRDESRAHILDRLTPLVVESMRMGKGISGGLSEVFSLLIKEAIGVPSQEEPPKPTWMHILPHSVTLPPSLFHPSAIVSGVLVPWSVCSKGVHCTGRKGSRDLDRSGVGYQLLPCLSK